MIELDLTTPVLFLIFNRPDTTKQVFEAIRMAKPKQLFIAADGPRIERTGEEEQCSRVRGIATAVDWDCEVMTLFRETNLGCKIAISSAIDWFFENVKEGIILEDDCLPSNSFFRFCQELLEMYRDDTRVIQICGFNPVADIHLSSYSYHFAKFGPTWGWASWSRAWKHYDVNMTLWPKIKKDKTYRFFCDSKREISWRVSLFNKMYNGKIDTWDYQWSFAKLINNGLSIIPSKNLIKNIGFGYDATHTKGKPPNYCLKHSEIEQNLKHPIFIIRDKDFDRLYFKYCANRPVYIEVIEHLKRIITK